MGLVEAGKRRLRTSRAPSETTRKGMTEHRARSDKITRMKDYGMGINAALVFFASEAIWIESPIHSPVFSLGEASAMTIGGVVTIGSLIASARKESKENIYRLDERSHGIDGDRYVYEGATLVDGDVTLNKGDNFYYINLPELTVPGEKPPTGVQKGLMSAFYTQVLRDIRQDITADETLAGCAGIVIDAGNTDITTSLTHEPARTRRADIFSGKQFIKVQDPDSLCTLISPEAFEALPLDRTPQQELRRKFITIMDGLKGDVKGTTIEARIREYVEHNQFSDTTMHDYLFRSFMQVAEGEYTEPTRGVRRGWRYDEQDVQESAYTRLALEPVDTTPVTLTA